MKPVIGILLLILGCGATGAQQLEAPATASNSDVPEAVKGDNDFSLDLYSHLRGQPGNLFFSPSSISTAFAMAYAGARGETAAEMQRVLHFTLPPDRLHPAMGALLARMNAPHPNYELHAADALWAQRDASFLPSYLTLVQSSYGAALHQVDFKTVPDAVRIAINQWADKQTNGKIQNLLAPGTVRPSTRLILTNAIYFKSAWRDPFDIHATRPGSFHLSPTQTVQAPLMHHSASYQYYDGDTFQMLDLPYKGNELSMIVLLPRAIDGLPALEESLTASALASWHDKMRSAQRVIVTFPRFTMTNQFELSSTLARMGMPQAFSNAADFSGMDGKRDFMISAAIHKAFIDVNEAGTEAAAATAITMMAMAMRQEPPPIVFTADHPFLFLIRENLSGNILFLGRVTDPTK